LDSLFLGRTIQTHIFGVVFVDTYRTKTLGKKAVKDSTILLLQLKPGKASNKHPLVIQVVQMKIRKTSCSWYF